jgi:multidrug efflux pump subunit AcrA (membrane-fusion protein)
LEALAEFVVAPKVSGRVERVLVNIADTVRRGQVVAELDNDEYVQAVAQARADLEVARANLSEAESALEIADREFKRTESLLKARHRLRFRVRCRQAGAAGQTGPAESRRSPGGQGQSALETANIRLGYTQVTAGWTGVDDNGRRGRALCGRRPDRRRQYAPAALIVDLDPIVGVVFVTERDYAQPAARAAGIADHGRLSRRTFTGRIDRIAPVFRTATRQARIEMTIDNPQHRLKPGMFIRPPWNCPGWRMPSSCRNRP